LRSGVRLLSIYLKSFFDYRPRSIDISDWNFKTLGEIDRLSGQTPSGRRSKRSKTPFAKVLMSSEMRNFATESSAS
jgi:hypothetical protein